MSWVEVILDFNINAEFATTTIDLLNQQFDNGIMYSVVSKKRVRLYASIRSHAPFWDSVNGQDVELRAGGEKLVAKVYLTSAPPF